jgi:hypothetical protein
MFAFAIDIWPVARSLTLRAAIFSPALHLARAVGMSTFFSFKGGHGEFSFQLDVAGDPSGVTWRWRNLLRFASSHKGTRTEGLANVEKRSLLVKSVIACRKRARSGSGKPGGKSGSGSGGGNVGSLRSGGSRGSGGCGTGGRGSGFGDGGNPNSA